MHEPGHHAPPFAITAAAFWIAVRILRIRPAAAEMPVHRRADLVLGRVLRRREQIGGLDHHPVLAVTAMRHLHVDPRLLQRMQRRRSSGRAALRRPQRRQPFERRDALPAHRRHRRDARADLLAVQQHRAGTTLRKAATEARAMQVELVVQDVQERCVEARAHAVREPVHLDLDAARHSVPPSCWRRSQRAGTERRRRPPRPDSYREPRTDHDAIVAWRKAGPGDGLRPGPWRPGPNC